MIYQSDYLKTTSDVLTNLNEFKDIFELEATIINYVKCQILLNDDLSDFNIAGYDVKVFKYNDRYDLYFSFYKITIFVYDRMIIDFQMNKV